MFKIAIASSCEGRNLYQFIKDYPKNSGHYKYTWFHKARVDTIIIWICVIFKLLNVTNIYAEPCDVKNTVVVTVISCEQSVSS